jgi:RNA polymerase sigma factor for flagellar operon FliA
VDQLDEQSFREALVEAVERLPERERLMMSLYYSEELNLKEIGAVLGVSESRVSQLARSGAGAASRGLAVETLRGAG